MNQKLWEPQLTGNSAIEKLQAEKGFDSYDQLHSWSINNPGQFWSQAWNDLEIVGSKGSNFYTPVSYTHLTLPTNREV